MRRKWWSMAVAAVSLAATLWLTGCGGGGAVAGVSGSRAVTQPAPAANAVTGQIKSLTGSGTSLTRFVLSPKPLPGQPPPPDATITVTPKTTYKAGAKAATAADLKAGMGVQVVLQAALSQNAGTATEVDILPPMASGVVKSVSSASGALQAFVLQAPPPPPPPPGGSGATPPPPPPDLTISVTAATKYTAGDKTVSASDLKVGMPVDVVLQAPPTADHKGTAVAVNLLPPKAAGKVKTVTPASGALQSFVLQPPPAPQGQTAPPDLTVKVTSATKYTKGPQTAAATDVKAGVCVEATLTAPPQNNTATAVVVNLVAPAHAVARCRYSALN